MGNKFHELSATNIKGEKIDFKSLKGKTVLIVNTASQCGFTPQLKELQAIYEKYQPKGLEILAFPSSQFMGQEPLEGDAIAAFCELNFKTTFPIMQKSDVRGENKNDVFRFLTDKKLNGKNSQQPWWNFWKYLIDKNGNLVEVFSSLTKPSSGKVIAAIEKTLN
jgi:glutathione peroxidase-family protein